MRVVFILFLFTCFSCNKDKVEFTERFPLQGRIELKVKSTTDRALISRVVKLVSFKDHLIVQDAVDGFCFALIEKETGQLVKRFGLLGKGPGELLYPASLKRQSDNFSFFDVYQGRFYLCSFDSLLNDEAYVLKTLSVQMRNSHFATAHCRDVIMLPNQELLAVGKHPGGRIVWFDSTGMEKGAFYPDYPYDEKHSNEDYISKSFAYQYDLYMHPDGDRLCVACATAGQIEIFKLQNGSLDRLCNNLYYLPDYENDCTENMQAVVFKKGSRHGLLYLTTDADYIYVFSRFETGRQIENYGNNFMFKFDWEGKPVKKYELSQCVMTPVVDSETKTLWGFVKDSLSLEPILVSGTFE